MEEIQALAEDLRFMVLFDFQPLFRISAAKPIRQRRVQFLHSDYPPSHSNSAERRPAMVPVQQAFGQCRLPRTTALYITSSPIRTLAAPAGAVTHVGGTSRVQTLSAEQNGDLYVIIDAFERKTRQAFRS